MRKNVILCIWVAFSLLLPGISLAGAQAAPAEPVPWQWLVDQVESGAQVVTLPGDIVSDGETGLAASGTVRIEGGGFSLTDALVDSGTIVFKDVRLNGIHGVDDEPGGNALVLRGDGAIAVLMGTSRAEGGRCGPEGETGGDGIQLLGNNQGLILNGTATAAGGIGRITGGAGVRVTGRDGSILLTDSAALIGSHGLIEGGDGLHANACCKVILEAQASVTGGSAQNTAGSGIVSQPDEACDAKEAGISLTGMAMAIGGVGQAGGHGILMERTEPDENAALSLGTCMIIGGDGETGGSAIHATNATIRYEDAAQIIGGQHYGTESPAMELTGCKVECDESAIVIVPGAKAKSYPASGVSTIINTALSQQSSRYTPKIIEDGLAVQATETKLNGFTVERGSTSQAKLSGNGLKIFMFGGTLEKRLQFQQRLMDDGNGSTRFVLIGAVSDEWPTIESSVAALRKLESLGVTQLAYTTVAPSYHDRVLDIATLLKALDAYEAEQETEVAKVMCGTADDAVIFILEDGTRDYQEELMPEVVRPVEG